MTATPSRARRLVALAVSATQITRHYKAMESAS